MQVPRKEPQCWGVHVKHGGFTSGGQGESSQTPSGPFGSWHCSPDSAQVEVGGSEMNVPRSHAASETREIMVRVRVAPIRNRFRTRDGTYEACAAGSRLRLGRILWSNFRLGCRLTARGSAAGLDDRLAGTAWFRCPIVPRSLTASGGRSAAAALLGCGLHAHGRQEHPASSA